jgi:hypothetical protein
VASCILQNFSCGIDLTRDLAEGVLANDMPDETKNDQYLFYLSSQWIGSLLSTREPPSFVHQGKYYPKETTLVSINSLIESFDKGEWDEDYFEKSKDNINRQETPELFDAEQEPVAEPEPEAPVAKELPPEIVAFYSAEECEQLMFFSEEDIEEIRQEVIETLEAEGKG